jgi:hypothetical protein
MTSELSPANLLLSSIADLAGHLERIAIVLEGVEAELSEVRASIRAVGHMADQPDFAHGRDISHALSNILVQLERIADKTGG